MKEIRTYIIADPSSSAVKIGRGIEPENRLRACQTGNPNQLVLLGSFEGDIESILHKTFKAHHKRGEWFYLRGELEAFICNVYQKRHFGYSWKFGERPNKKDMSQLEHESRNFLSAIFGEAIRLGSEHERISRDEWRNEIDNLQYISLYNEKMRCQKAA